MKKKNIKLIKPKMEFNPGTQKYEPVLPLKRIGKKFEVKINLKWIILLIITLIILIGLILLALKNELI